MMERSPDDRMERQPVANGDLNPGAAGADAAIAPAKRLPLAGIRIADLSAVWAGPYATRLLADMGAEVIKVESAGSPDLLRTLGLQPPGTERPYNRSAYFNHNNRNKYGCSIDLAAPGGKELFLDLVKVSDIVIENFRADVLDNLGLGYDVLRAVRPDIILISMPGHGKTGPEARHVAYGTNVEQLAGLVSITGYEGGEPHKSGVSYGDPVSGTAAAGAIMTALLYRRRTGNGQFIDLAQREALTTLLGEFVVHYGMTRRLPRPSGNSHPAWAPHGAFPCAGDDQWLTIAVRDDAEFASLCGVIDRPDLAQDPRFADALSRFRNRSELDEPISVWTSQHEPLEAAAALQSAGVPAGAVESYRHLLDDDPQLRARGFFEEVTHPEAGTWRMERPVWRFSDAPAHVRINGPSFAEHNDFVFQSLLGLEDREITALTASGAVGEHPDTAVHGR
jgi:crotonobetainyl-CoA:carnitine CoA-transferase CaiB-like acyl-CoA transferase